MTQLLAIKDTSETGAGGEPQPNQALTHAWGYIKANGMGLMLDVLVNFVLPYIIYDRTKSLLGDVDALIASSGPPIICSLVEFARRRRLDALSILVLSGIGLSVVAFLAGGSAHLLQLREKLITALIGLVFLASALIGRPLIYQLARATLARRNPGELGAFEALRDNPFFKRSMTVMTLVWGVGLLSEAALATVLVYSLSVREYLIFGPMVGNGAMAALGVWTFWYSRRQRRLGEARRRLQPCDSATTGLTAIR